MYPHSSLLAHSIKDCTMPEGQHDMFRVATIHFSPKNMFEPFLIQFLSGVTYNMFTTQIPASYDLTAATLPALIG